MVQTKWLVAQIIFNTAEDESSNVWQMAPPDDPKMSDGAALDPC